MQVRSKWHLQKKSRRGIQSDSVVTRPLWPCRCVATTAAHLKWRNMVSSESKLRSAAGTNTSKSHLTDGIKLTRIDLNARNRSTLYIYILKEEIVAFIGNRVERVTGGGGEGMNSKWSVSKESHDSQQHLEGSGKIIQCGVRVGCRSWFLIKK